MNNQLTPDIHIDFEKYINEFITDYGTNHDPKALKAWIKTKEGKQAFEDYIDNRFKEDYVEQVEL